MKNLLLKLFHCHRTNPVDTLKPLPDYDLAAYSALLKARLLFDNQQLVETAVAVGKTFGLLKLAEVRARVGLLERIDLNATEIAHRRQLERLRAASLRFADTAAEASCNGIELSIGQDQ